MKGQVSLRAADGREILVSWDSSPEDGETMVSLRGDAAGSPLVLSVPELIRSIGILADQRKATLMFRIG